MRRTIYPVVEASKPPITCIQFKGREKNTIRSHHNHNIPFWIIHILSDRGLKCNNSQENVYDFTNISICFRYEFCIQKHLKAFVYRTWKYKRTILGVFELHIVILQQQKHVGSSMLWIHLHIRNQQALWYAFIKVLSMFYVQGVRIHSKVYGWTNTTRFAKFMPTKFLL